MSATEIEQERSEERKKTVEEKTYEVYERILVAEEGN